MKFIVFYLQLIKSFEGLGMFFSSAVLTRRLRKHTATITPIKNIKESSHNFNNQPGAPSRIWNL